MVCCFSYLLKRDTPGQQLDEISGSYDGVRVERFPSGADCHATFNQVQRRFYVLGET